MASASGIRAGAAYIEITADDRPMQQRLAASQARLKAWVAANSGGMGPITKATEGALSQEDAAASGLPWMKWPQLVARGVGIAVAAHAIGAGMSMLAGVLKGEWEKVPQAIEGVPVLGPAAIALANGFDDLVLGMRAGMKKMIEEAKAGLADAQAALAGAQRELVLKFQIAMAGADPFQRQLMAIDERARQTAEAEKQKATQAGLAVTHPQTQANLARIEELRQAEQARAYRERAAKDEEKWQSRAKDATDAVARSRMDLAKAMMSEDDYLELEVRQLGYSADRTAELLAYRKEILRVKREEAAEKDRIEMAQMTAEYAGKTITDELERLQSEMDQARREAESVTEQMMTPEERAGAKVEHLENMRESGDITGETYQRAINKALEDAAAAMPDVAARATIGVRGTFSAIEAASALGAGGTMDRLVTITEKNEGHLKRIAELAAKFGVTYTD